MARIGENAFRQYVDGQDRLTAREYTAERELIRLAVNDLDDKVQRTEGIREEFANTVGEVEVVKGEIVQTKQEMETKIGEFSQTLNQTASKEEVQQIVAEVENKASKDEVSQVSSQLADTTKNVVTVIPSGTDDTLIIQNILNSGDIPRLINGTYIVSSLVLNDNAKIMTSGYKTKLKQKAGLTGDIRILAIQGSNIVVDEMSYEGNIATDTGEQRHAVFIRSNTKEITNITVKGILASNVRGDGLYIGGVTAYNPKNVSIGNVTVTNCYRNGVSLTGGNNINIGDIYAVNCGMIGVDLESDTAGGHLNNVKVGNVITSSLGIIASGNGYPFVENVEFGYVECRKSRNTSSPDFPSQSQDQDAVIFRNSRNIKIKGLDIDGFDRFAVHFLKGSEADRYNDNITIENLTVANCSLMDTSYNCYVFVGGVNTLRIHHITSNIQNGKSLIKGGSETANGQNVIINSAVHSGGAFASFCGLNANNIKITSNTGTLSYLKPLSRIANSTIDAERILSYSNNVIIEACALKWTLAQDVNGKNIYKNNIINGTFVT